jgi:flagellin
VQSIATNLVSLFTQRGLSTVQSALSTSVQRLSSGMRINAAKDDAAGLGITQELQRQTRAYQVATRNADDAVSMVQTAESSLQSVGDLLQRLKTLTVQGANDSLSKEQRGFIADEISQLRNEINAVATRTTFNGISLLTGDFSQAVQGEFVKAAQLDSAANSVLKTSTIKIGEASDANPDLTKSLFSFADVQVDSAADGTYSLSNNGAVLTLTRVVGNTTETQTLTLVSGVASSRSQVAFNNTLNDSFTLDFSDFGVSITVKNDRVGGADRSASEIATKISAIGITPNEAYQNQGWKAVSGADWASGAGTLKAVITSSAGQVRTTSIAGVAAVTGYPALGTSTLNATTGKYEMAFKGTAAQLNTVLATLQVNNTTGMGEVSVDVLPETMSVFTNPNTGATSYYEVVNSGSIVWSAARAAASARTFSGLTGYLANLSSTEESAFIQSKLSVDGWIGASDEAVEGVWRWMDGPEAGLQFWQGAAAGSTVSGGAGQVTTAYANWAAGEPNDSGSNEDYAYAIGGGNWNDYSGTNAGPTAYIVEYGGQVGVNANTSKTILIGTPGYINVGDALTLESVQTSGVGSGAADTGVYKLTADASAKTLTLKRFDVDGETLLQSQTITEKNGIGSGRYKTLTFDELGVSVQVTNSSDREITFGDAESGLTAELTVASSRMASLIGDDGPKFQTGTGSRNDLAINVFRDIRLGKNADSQNSTLFNEVNNLINELDSAADPSIATFQTLESRVEDMITVVVDIRGDMGAVQNRLASTRNNITEQLTNLSAAQSQIMDTDFAGETARLTRMQIGQQASTAMLAQANQIPNVILALLK